MRSRNLQAVGPGLKTGRTRHIGGRVGGVEHEVAARDGQRDLLLRGRAPPLHAAQQQPGDDAEAKADQRATYDSTATFGPRTSVGCVGPGLAMIDSTRLQDCASREALLLHFCGSLRAKCNGSRQIVQLIRTSCTMAEGTQNSTPNAPTASQTIFQRIFQMMAPAEALRVPVALSLAVATKPTKMENRVKELASFSRLSPSRMMRRCSGPPPVTHQMREIRVKWVTSQGRVGFNEMPRLGMKDSLDLSTSQQVDHTNNTSLTKLPTLDEVGQPRSARVTSKPNMRTGLKDGDDGDGVGGRDHGAKQGGVVPFPPSVLQL